MVHSNIYNLYIDPDVACEDIDGGAPLNKVVSHLSRHFPRIGADSLFHDSMVGSEDENQFLSQKRRVLSLDAGHAKRQLFQPSQTPLRFGELIQTSLGHRFHGALNGNNFF